MLAAIFAVTVRHRRPILATALVLAVILAVGRQLSTWLDLILGNATFVVGVLACSLAALAWRRPQPAALSVTSGFVFPAAGAALPSSCDRTVSTSAMSPAP
ncbi:hypothetical protein [Micromonospora chersina]|uniref:hypothetical protein n=1 Tax=Micromonospora chersina TaxID=47854 RepID=UPI0033B1BCE1